MKLRNKKTGGLANIDELSVHTDAGWHDYHSLAELNEEWEDYEEIGYWYIDFDGDVLSCVEPFDDETEQKRKEIGNYFDTREEAEKVVEKLKAWKRLKDTGFKLDGWTIDDGLRVSVCTNFDSDGIYDEDRKEAKKDLDICFGGEE